MLLNYGMVLEFHVHIDAINEYIERCLAPCDNIYIFSQLCEKEFFNISTTEALAYYRIQLNIFLFLTLKIRSMC